MRYVDDRYLHRNSIPALPIKSAQDISHKIMLKQIIKSDTVVVIGALILFSHHKKKVKQQNKSCHHQKNKAIKEGST
jgi:hypothetical protein